VLAETGTGSSSEKATVKVMLHVPRLPPMVNVIPENCEASRQGWLGAVK